MVHVNQKEGWYCTQLSNKLPGVHKHIEHCHLTGDFQEVLMQHHIKAAMIIEMTLTNVEKNWHNTIVNHRTKTDFITQLKISYLCRLASDMVSEHILISVIGISSQTLNKK